MDRRQGTFGAFRVGEDTGQWRLMGDESSQVARVGGHQCQSGHCSAAAREHVDRSGAERRDDRMHILGLHDGRVGDLAVAACAPPQAAWVVRDHLAVGEVRRQCPKAARIHRLADHDERCMPVLSVPRVGDIVDDLGAGRADAVRFHV